ncbi:MAG: hypothetical protein MUF15_10515 [Acidobacteria bacterium]|jgi:hypothetical protein|nr:hypothetical protein [Acidobacteriota bacterium]
MSILRDTFINDNIEIVWDDGMNVVEKLPEKSKKEKDIDLSSPQIIKVSKPSNVPWPKKNEVSVIKAGWISTDTENITIYAAACSNDVCHNPGVCPLSPSSILIERNAKCEITKEKGSWTITPHKVRGFDVDSFCLEISAISNGSTQNSFMKFICKLLKKFHYNADPSSTVTIGEP